MDQSLLHFDTTQAGAENAEAKQKSLGRER